MAPMSVRASALGVVMCLLAVGPSCKPTTAPQPTGDAKAEPTVDYENPGGMWMPTQMASHKDTLQTLGIGYDPTSLGDPTAFPLGAVISLGGCSASFVSPKGLVVTNHHCVIGALQNNSTAEHNLKGPAKAAALAISCRASRCARSRRRTGRCSRPCSFTRCSRRLPRRIRRSRAT